MKLAMTLVCGDEAPVVDAQIAFHLHAGVDLIVADSSLEDGVADVLEAYASEGYVHLVRAPADDVPPLERARRLVRLAATELRADWVVNSDRGEFWWPRGGTLEEVLAAIPKRFGVVSALPRSFVPQPDDGSFFADRLTVRLSTQALIGASDRVTRSRLGVVRRADPHMALDDGSWLGESSLDPLRGWYPIEVFRLPVGAQDDGALLPGTNDGALVVDTRLRDVLHALRRQGNGLWSAQGYALPAEREAFQFPRPSVVDDAAYAVEVAAFGEVDEAVMRRRLDEAERRIVSLERSAWDRACWKLGRLRRRT
jgi:hypothetical protein